MNVECMFRAGIGISFFFFGTVDHRLSASVNKVCSPIRDQVSSLLRDIIVITILAKRQLHYQARFCPVPWHAVLLSSSVLPYCQTVRLSPPCFQKEDLPASLHYCHIRAQRREIVYSHCMYNLV